MVTYIVLSILIVIMCILILRLPENENHKKVESVLLIVMYINQTS